jgi:hypothetical protein
MKTIATSDLNYAAVLIALGIGQLTSARPAQQGSRLIAFELVVAPEDLQQARDLEQRYDDLRLLAPNPATTREITLGRFLDGVQRARRAMRDAQAVAR